MNDPLASQSSCLQAAFAIESHLRADQLVQYPVPRHSENPNQHGEVLLVFSKARTHIYTGLDDLLREGLRLVSLEDDPCGTHTRRPACDEYAPSVPQGPVGYLLLRRERLPPLLCLCVLPVKLDLPRAFPAQMACVRDADSGRRSRGAYQLCSISYCTPRRSAWAATAGAMQSTSPRALMVTGNDR